MEPVHNLSDRCHASLIHQKTLATQRANCLMSLHYLVTNRGAGRLTSDSINLLQIRHARGSITIQGPLGHLQAGVHVSAAVGGFQNPQVVLHRANQVWKMYGIICKPTCTMLSRSCLQESLMLVHCCAGRATCRLYLTIGISY